MENQQLCASMTEEYLCVFVWIDVFEVEVANKNEILQSKHDWWKYQ